MGSNGGSMKLPPGPFLQKSSQRRQQIVRIHRNPGPSAQKFPEAVSLASMDPVGAGTEPTLTVQGPENPRVL